MKLQEIKDAVNNGKTVHWANEGYKVKRWQGDHWVVVCTHNDHAVGLTRVDGITMTHNEAEFFIAP